MQRKMNGSSPRKEVVKYKECQKNHAAAIGGNATDGCGEFMPSGEEGTIEALKCLACNCHRNFHRKESSESDFPSSKAFILGHNHNPQFLGYPTIMSYKNTVSIPSESDEKEDNGGSGFVSNNNNNGHSHRLIEKMRNKRFRTKFTQEQKQKMLDFAEKSGWSIQKFEDSVVQEFCQEIGIKRRILKVWMHNNKYSVAKKLSSSS